MTLITNPKSTNHDFFFTKMKESGFVTLGCVNSGFVDSGFVAPS